MGRNILFFVVIGLFFTLSACDENDNLQVFSLDQEIQLGQQLDSSIMSNPQEYPVLDTARHADAYSYLENIFFGILNSEEVAYRETFPWQIRIIQNDSTLNAFAAPGGFVYVYTGLIRYLDSEDDLAGVLGHEIAHADLRHSMRNIQRQYGIGILLSLILGEGGNQLTQIVAQLAAGAAGLSFSREFEREADEASVEYLSQTPYNCAGARSFFQKLTEDGKTSGIPTFLSTHPNPTNRFEDITDKAQAIGCSTQPYNPPSYQDFQRMLPG
ncbi:M48 family metalloprotease [Tunicatimonas pelagia]|uniref:M48 family metalloprotease n=1 Tax=Tunicatimonas pelagia TaxID=931531 RepID=UPI002665DF72|nr:M48 family metalloprotease [Tunicatimonas pelagia]WKN43616.1 M48 family metalloprotease [Tunicatimonas pelagia]